MGSFVVESKGICHSFLHKHILINELCGFTRFGLWSKWRGTCTNTQCAICPWGEIPNRQLHDCQDGHMFSTLRQAFVALVVSWRRRPVCGKATSIDWNGSFGSLARSGEANGKDERKATQSHLSNRLIGLWKGICLPVTLLHFCGKLQALGSPGRLGNAGVW